jgi:hypothetical protein
MIFWFKDNINPVDSTEAQDDTDSNHDSDEESGELSSSIILLINL